VTCFLVSFASSAIRRPDEDGSRRTFRVFTCVVAAAESADSTAAAAAAVSDICTTLSDAFLSCGPRPRAQLDVINMTLELVHALSTHLRVAAALPGPATGCLRDTFVSALTVPSNTTPFITFTSQNICFDGLSGSSDMALSAASGISLLITSVVISGAAAADAFTMLCDLAAKEQNVHPQVEARGGDETVSLHLHACRLVASCISSSSSSRAQFETICKSRVIPSVSSHLCAAFKVSSPSFTIAAEDAGAETSASGSQQLSPSVACITALCRCSTLVPAVVASFMPELIQYLQVIFVITFVFTLLGAAACRPHQPPLCPCPPLARPLGTDIYIHHSCNVDSVTVAHPFLQGGTAAELLFGMAAASGDDANVASELFTDMVLPCCRALSQSDQQHSSNELTVSSSIVALASLAAKCMRMARDQLASLVALYASLGLDHSFCELPPGINALIITSCIVNLRPDVHDSLPVINLCILLANSGLLEAPCVEQSLCVGAGAALGSLVNKCEASLSASAAAAAIDVLHQRVSTQSEPNAAARSLAWILRFVRARLCFESVFSNIVDKGADGKRACIRDGV
jgi:hypothetical protein